MSESEAEEENNDVPDQGMEKCTCKWGSKIGKN